MIALLSVILHPGPYPGEREEWDRIEWEWGAWPLTNKETKP